VGVEQHLVTLARVGDQHEGSARTQLQVRHQKLPPDPADHQPLFAPVELERFAQLEPQRHKSARRRVRARLHTPVADEIGQDRVTAGIALRFQFRVKRLRRTPVALRAPRIGFQRLQQRTVEGVHLPGACTRR